nr:hypothetical protein [Bacillus sp. T3]
MLILLFIVAFCYNLLGLLYLVPIYITSPILFIVLFILLSKLNDRKKFKGF